ncbi:MAG: M6 family metalloprotease domain-containing protein [Dictyoglomus sp.]|nr:M6 family metalloprotease domain-containing protein [Dictyoglomus sp.]MDW8188277.1 M6 family metalloprotease domain-containing protein [Dictyoglomus sp.]
MRKVIGFLVFLILILSFTSAETLPLTKVKIMPPHEKLIEKKLKLPTLPEIAPVSIPKDKKIYGIIEKAEGVGKAIVIPVHFTDKPKQPDNVIPSNYFDILFNSTGANWSSINPYNKGSVRDFIKENSYNIFDISATILPWYTAQRTYTYYINDGNYGFNGGVFVLVQEVLQHAVNSGYDLRNFDVIFIIHSGEGAEWTGNVNDIWSHASTVYVNIGGQNVPIRYSIEPEYMKDNNVIIPMTVGVFVHEMGHSFGQLPDLYDRDYSSYGLGRWSLMAGGSWNGPQSPSGYTIGGSPSHFDAWCKIQLGWITPIVPKDNLTNVNIPPVETNPVVYKLWTDGVEGDQYFLLENRRKIGFDSYLRGEGLLIYHVDEKMRGSQNDYEWYPGLDPSKHYLVALEQADGKWDLEKKVNSGDSGDPYPGSTNKTIFDENSTPNSKAYFEIPTGVAVKNITVSGQNIIANIYVSSIQLNVSPVFDPNKENCIIMLLLIRSYILTINVYDTLNGQKNNLVKTIVNNQKVNNGSYNYTWNGRDETNTLLPNGKYIIEAIAKDEIGNSKSISATTTLNSGQPLSFVNVTRFTKSFNPKTGPAEIFFNLTQDAKVRFIVYNLAGEKVYERDLGYLFAGNHKIEWEGINWKGIYLPNGLYLFQLVAESSQGESRINRFIGILK